MVRTNTKRRSPRLHNLDSLAMEDCVPHQTHPLSSKRRRDSEEEVHLSLAKKSKLDRQFRQKPTPIKETVSLPSTISTWWESFDLDHESNGPVPKILAQPPSDKPETPPSDFDDLEDSEVKSISTIANTSSNDDTSGIEEYESVESSSKDYRSLVAQPLFRVNRLSNNNIYLYTSVCDEPKDVAKILKHIKTTQQYPEPSLWEYEQIKSLTWGHETPKPSAAVPDAATSSAAVSDAAEPATAVSDAAVPDPATSTAGWSGQFRRIDQMVDEFTYKGPIEVELNANRPSMGVGLSEDDVKSTLKESLLNNPFMQMMRLKGIKITNKVGIDRQTIPSIRLEQELKLPTPAPDILFGSPRTFIPGYQGNVAQANDTVSYPFLTMEFKGMWAATNQCVLGCVACSNIAGNVSDSLVESGQPPLTTTAFGVATNGSEARLFVSWREKGEDNTFQFNVSLVDAFILNKRVDYLTFRMYFFNICAWGLARMNLLVTYTRRMHADQSPEDIQGPE
ncbi:hypothetical protein M434DRAFT_392161 [Hypoxylon sp. CO27-5]|nr:hypothetical protein M434DRAFT_392161 [Hypoxylon sp. CO27-5]